MPVIDDIYPSRVSDRPEIIERRDPVLHGSPEDRPSGPLTAGQLSRFERDGFLILPGFFSEGEVADCLAELDVLRTDEGVKLRPESIVEPDRRELRSLFSVHTLSRFFAGVAADARLVGLARQILGSAVYVHQSRINLKPGFNGKEFAWHSDFETWHVEDGMPRMRALSCSLLLTPNYEYNGPLMVVPKSHRRYVTCVGRTPEEHFKQSLKRQEYGVPDEDSLTRLIAEGGIETCTGPAGTLVVFDCNTMHGSSSNISPFPRTNLFLVYNSVLNQLQDPYCGLKPRPEFIAARRHAETVAPEPTGTPTVAPTGTPMETSANTGVG